jgi:hypothetical protein
MQAGNYLDNWFRERVFNDIVELNREYFSVLILGGKYYLVKV